MSLFKSLLDKLKVKPAKSPAENKKLYYDVLLKAMEDGVLTNGEIAELDALRKELGLSEKDVAGMRTKAFQVAVNSATADGIITPKEQKDLDKITAYLNLGESDLARNKGTLAKMRLLYEIDKGNLPIEEIPGLAMALGEVAHINQDAELLEDPTGATPRPGTTVAFKAGAPFRMGAGRAAPLPEVGLVEAANGALTITSHRLMFNTGAKGKNFALRYELVGQVWVYSNGLGITSEQGGTRYVRIENKKDIEMIAAIISRFLNPPKST